MYALQMFTDYATRDASLLQCRADSFGFDTTTCLVHFNYLHRRARRDSCIVRRVADLLLIVVEEKCEV